MQGATGRDRRVAVIGAGIGGLTAGALLAKRGYAVDIYDRAWVPGGCASTFKRRGFTFDVGATQVAGLEPGGIHHQIFAELGVELPPALPCDPACAVYLPGEREPINVWRDPQRWQQERQRQFPGSEPFWWLLGKLFAISWRFQAREPVLPPRNTWDLGQLLGALRPDTFLTLPFALMTVGDALRLYGLDDDRRLRTFLDLQLKLYSQVGAEETALLYAATSLSVSQAPQGLFHLEGSMQILSDRLVEACQQHGGRLHLGRAVEKIHARGGRVAGITVRNVKTSDTECLSVDDVVANVTANDLLQLLAGEDDLTPWQMTLLENYQRRLEKLPAPSGAFALYLGVEAAAIPPNCPPHLQFFYDRNGPIGENNSLFVSVSRPGDGRAPADRATIVASSFTDTSLWWQDDRAAYETRKQAYTAGAIARLGEYFKLSDATIVHQEAATPRTFARFTSRDRGSVGGVGQRLSTFGPFGFATRTPVDRLWLVGDSTHPGEGTAGVSYSAQTVVRQIEAASSS